VQEMLEVKPLELKEVLLITPKRFGDRRGYFSETYNKNTFSEAGITLEFVQDNHSTSAETGTIRGLHFQKAPKAQAKLVRVVRGSVFDVAVDIRKSSPTFGKWVSAVLTAERGEQIFVPVGYAHGYCTLEPDTEVIYKVSEFYAPDHELAIRWDDPAIGISWPLKGAPVLSPKDEISPLLKDSPSMP
jgi:dTDP-4-dehydrorhamnose 3,5-epimerase